MSNIYESDTDVLREMGLHVPASRFIQIKGKGLDYNVLDSGIDAVFRIYEMAKENKVPYAESVKVSYCANCDVFFSGANLIKFISEFYPERLPDYEPHIKPDDTYKLMCIDFS